MCGICGLVSLDGATPPDPGLLRAMSDALVHRGPDSSGEVLQGPAALAARRLAIIDVHGGDQPIANESGEIHVAHNGEIFNHAELRDRLERQGHRFATHCDTEVLVHLYEQHGERLAEDLRGMFAAAVWDGRRRRLLLVRDPFGIKPLYWSAAGGRLAFASELAALMLAPWLSDEVDPDALEAYLAFNSIPAPMTIHRGVHKLPAGHLLTWQEGGEVRVERYARPAPAPAAELRREPAAELAVELRERLRDSVRAHLVSDVPVGVLLSGGVDSSALTALAAAETPGRVSTFTIGFEERSFDELDGARLVARRYGTDHHELVLRPDAAALLGELAGVFDEPYANSSALPTYLVSKLAAEHVKVVLSGEGADELFGGYYTYAAHRLADRFGPWAGRLAPLAARLPASTRRASFDLKAKRFTGAAALPALERHHAFKEIFSPALRAELVTRRNGPPADPMALLRARYAETEGAEPLARLQDVDIGLYLVDDLLTRTDRASMAHSLEARVPYLDREVHALARALPAHLRVRGLAKKRLLRQAVAPLVPRRIVTGRKKGFSIPAAAWLRGDLQPMARDLLSPEALRRGGLFEPAAVGRLLDEHAAGRHDHSRRLWGLLMFVLWDERRTRAGVAA
jgi:asparagine synthase (glutamine-hydrolysing)